MANVRRLAMHVLFVIGGSLLFSGSVTTALVTNLAADEQPASPTPEPAAPLRGDLLVVLGAEGTPEYGARFANWTAVWESSAERGQLKYHLVGDLVGDATSSKAKLDLQKTLAELATEAELPLWIVLIGHGTFDGRVTKFNLVGEDISGHDLANWLAPMSRPVAIAQCSSASGPFLEALSGPDRVVITATKSGPEINYTHFGGYFAVAFSDPAADLDKDQQVSLLEAFLAASRRTEEFYAGENRLATEHAQLDDNGDAIGVRSTSFSGVRPVRQRDSSNMLDGYIAHQWILIPNAAEAELDPEVRERRDAIELAVIQLRERKASIPEEEYYAELERLLIDLARLSLGRETADSTETPAPPTGESPAPEATTPPSPEAIATPESTAPSSPAPESTASPAAPADPSGK